MINMNARFSYMVLYTTIVDFSSLSMVLMRVISELAEM